MRRIFLPVIRMFQLSSGRNLCKLAECKAESSAWFQCAMHQEIKKFIIWIHFCCLIILSRFSTMHAMKFVQDCVPHMIHPGQWLVQLVSLSSKPVWWTHFVSGQFSSLISSFINAKLLEWFEWEMFQTTETKSIEREVQNRKESHNTHILQFWIDLLFQSQLFSSVYCKMNVKSFTRVTFHKTNIYSVPSANKYSKDNTNETPLVSADEIWKVEVNVQKWWKQFELRGVCEIGVQLKGRIWHRQSKEYSCVQGNCSH